MFRRINSILCRNLLVSDTKHDTNYVRYFYDVKAKSDTIFAPATQIASSKGAPLGVIRVSGSLTNDIIEKFTKLTTSSNNQSSICKSIEPRKATLVKISQPSDPREVLDVGLVVWFPKPNSYTGEDVCEFHLHGSQAIMKQMLYQLGRLNGLRPAEPGEFTKRAVMNKKMNLVQAESLPDLIASKTDKQRKLALKGLEGSVTKKYEQWLTELVNILAHLEASIDFGEDELIGEVRVVNECIERLQILSQNLSNYISQQSRSSNYIRNGFKIAIMGRPNVGKSSIMNKLCQSERSIVSDICGTTRDVIEQCFELGGHSLILCDTAGLRDFPSQDVNTIALNDPNHEVDGQQLIEQEGIKRAIEEGTKADVILYVIDVNQLRGSVCNLNQLSGEIISLLEKIHTNTKSENEPSERKLLQLILNKIDLGGVLMDEYNNLFDNLIHLVENKLAIKQLKNFTIVKSCVSCKSGQNFENLVGTLSHQLDNIVSDNSNGHIDNCNFEALEFVNERHLAFLSSCQSNIHRASQLELATIDRMAQHVRDATDYLSRCLGTVDNEQVLDIIFRDFCIGK